MPMSFAPLLELRGSRQDTRGFAGHELGIGRSWHSSVVLLVYPLPVVGVKQHARLCHFFDERGLVGVTHPHPFES